MATAKTKAPAKKAKSDIEVLVEEMKAAAKRHNLCDTFYTELAKANKKLANPLPDEAVVRKTKYNIEIAITNVEWQDGPASTYRRELATDRNAEVKAFKEGIQKAVQDFIKGYTPSIGTIKVKSGVKPTVNVRGYDSDNYY